jgi:hypothetical protein
MEEMHINIMAVLAAVAANFVLGFIWYTPLFGKVWAKENGFDTNQKAKGGEIARGMIFMVIGNFFMAYVLAHSIIAWSFVPGVKEMSATSNILNSAIFTWLGFYVPVDLNTVAWERKSWKLFGINTSYHFLTLLVASSILTFM